MSDPKPTAEPSDDCEIYIRFPEPVTIAEGVFITDKALAEKIEAAEQAARADGYREGLEEAAKAVCEDCRNGLPVDARWKSWNKGKIKKFSVTHDHGHGTASVCKAAAIRAKLGEETG